MIVPDVRDLILGLPGLVLAIVVHEYAHGWTADRLGDPTARLAGRLTLNPLAHLDWLGVLMLWVAHFGWAKPVPVDPRHFRDPRRGMLTVALAGPVANFLLAFLAAFLLSRLFGAFPWAYGGLAGAVATVLELALVYNVALGVFNLIPIPPLDGSRILASLLPPRLAWRYHRLDPYGWVILLILLFTGLGGRWIATVVSWATQAVYGVFR
ncbi:MAG: site-2 protease family protein [Clostridia bacterium]|nr:site-2 protease family protein [Clostridia bacterium]